MAYQHVKIDRNQSINFGTLYFHIRAAGLFLLQNVTLATQLSQTNSIQYAIQNCSKCSSNRCFTMVSSVSFNFSSSRPSVQDIGCWNISMLYDINVIMRAHMILFRPIIIAVSQIDVQCHQGNQTACNWCLSFVLVSLYHISKPVVLTNIFVQRRLGYRVHFGFAKHSCQSHLDRGFWAQDETNNDTSSSLDVLFLSLVLSHPILM